MPHWGPVLWASRTHDVVLGGGDLKLCAHGKARRAARDLPELHGVGIVGRDEADGRERVDVQGHGVCQGHILRPIMLSCSAVLVSIPAGFPACAEALGMRRQSQQALGAVRGREEQGVSSQDHSTSHVKPRNGNILNLLSGCLAKQLSMG